MFDLLHCFFVTSFFSLRFRCRPFIIVMPNLFIVYAKQTWAGLVEYWIHKLFFQLYVFHFKNAFHQFTEYLVFHF